MLEKHKHHNSHNEIKAAGLLITLGIIYGDIGTSPLYVLKAIVGEGGSINDTIVLGGLSCIFWTLTLQTTVKYVVLILRADNKGEGGIFSLYALVRRKIKWLFAPAMIGGAALLADGLITPPISVASAVEGLQILKSDIPTVPIIIGILSFLFLLQRFGTKVVGNAFGPLMFIWFTMLAVLGITMIIEDFTIFRAINPYYAYDMLFNYHEGFWLLGAVFLCTTGAEALYSDLGHCGRNNIRITWVYVKTCLLLNYFGQGAWLLKHNGEKLDQNPFFSIMPEWFIIPGIVIATIAAIIASQALITGSFTLVSEAIRLNFYPKVKLNYPTEEKGQLYVPSLNNLMWIGCIGVVLYFQQSSKMEAAYGLAITTCMLMTTFLFAFYLFSRKINIGFISLFIILYLIIEFVFLAANLKKFQHGGYVSLIIGGIIFIIMFIWYEAYKIKNRLTEYVQFDKDVHIPMLQRLSKDIAVPKYATNLIFMTSARASDQIESKVLYSIFQKQPKRADVYWFIHVEITDEPYTMNYKVKTYAEGQVIRVILYLGFRIENRINLYFRKIVEDLVKNGEVDIRSRYESLSAQNAIGDFRFVVLEKFLSYENDLPAYEQLIMDGYFFLKQYATSEEKYFGLDTSSVTVEKVPLLIRPASQVKLQRIH
ncbi:MAG: KUP/HAK/KT family potassium transporter [Bacteroidota bacterium]|nr:KUP/HAK/KT family potassium transporter [Bacteroidota bacterium]